MREKIFLLETSVEKQNRIEYDPNSTYALGLAYLDAVLKKDGYEVVTKDFAQTDEAECLNNIKNIILEFKPKIIGISMMSMTRASSYKVIKLIKNLDKNIKIILGGIHASIMYEQLLKNFLVDCVVVGEGEETIREIIPALFSNNSLKNIKGIAFRKGNKVIKTKERELIKNLDDLSFPSHDVFMNPQRTKICVLSSRGCPNNCSFCCLHLITKRRYRIRSYMNIVEEIESILAKFPNITDIEFSDDTFTLNMQRVIDFCKEIIKRKIKINFVCSARIKPASREMFLWMQRAGFKEVRFGIETGSRKMLESIHKAITPEEIIETFKIASIAKKINFVKFLMVGFPGENEETVNETIELSKKLNRIIPMNFFYATPLWVYPGTEVYGIMKEAGKINDDFWLSDNPCPLYTVEHSEAELIAMSNKISFETCLDRGYLYFTKVALRKILSNPLFQFKRIVRSKFRI